MSRNPKEQHEDIASRMTFSVAYNFHMLLHLESILKASISKKYGNVFL